MATSRLHSVFWTASSLYTCGLNVGQLGYQRAPDAACERAPRPVAGLLGKSVQLVHCTELVSLVVARDADTPLLYLLYRFACRKLNVHRSRLEHLRRVCVVGGALDAGSSGASSAISSSLPSDLLAALRPGAPLAILLLTDTGTLLFALVPDSGPLELRALRYSIGRSLRLVDISAHARGLHLLTSSGELYSCKLPASALPSSQAQSQSTSIPAASTTTSSATQQRTSTETSAPPVVHQHQHQQSELLDLNRVPNAHRAVAVFANSVGSEFCILQNLPNAW